MPRQRKRQAEVGIGRHSENWYGSERLQFVRLGRQGRREGTPEARPFLIHFVHLHLSHEVTRVSPVARQSQVRPKHRFPALSLQPQPGFRCPRPSPLLLSLVTPKGSHPWRPGIRQSPWGLPCWGICAEPVMGEG